MTKNHANSYPHSYMTVYLIFSFPGKGSRNDCYFYSLRSMSFYLKKLRCISIKKQRKKSFASVGYFLCSLDSKMRKKSIRALPLICSKSTLAAALVSTENASPFTYDVGSTDRSFNVDARF